MVSQKKQRKEPSDFSNLPKPPPDKHKAAISTTIPATVQPKLPSSVPPKLHTLAAGLTQKYKALPLYYCRLNLISFQLK